MHATTPRAGVRTWLGLVILVLPALIIAMDFTALHLATPHLAADPLSVVLSMAALLPIVYAIKELAKNGLHVLPFPLIAVGVLAGVVFVRRQRTLTNPLLDTTLFARRTFSVSLGAQTLGLFSLGAIQFLLMQYLQLVVGLSPLHAGLWTAGPVLVGVAGSLLAPRAAQLTSRVHAVAGGFGLAALGFLAILPGGLGWTVAGFTVVSFGINLGMVLAYDMILGSAPPERAGTASGMAETGNELGIAWGIAIIGSLSSALYRAQVTEETLPSLPTDAVATAREGLGNATALAGELPTATAEPLVTVARDAFAGGVQISAGLLAVVTGSIAVATITLLRGRHAPASDIGDGHDSGEADSVPDDARTP